MTPPGRRARATALVATAVLGAAAPARALDVGAGNLLEVRAGSDPDDPFAASNRLTRFDQFDLDAVHGPVRAGFRFETYAASDDSTARFNYDLFVRRWAMLTQPGLEIRVGNSEALLGRGLLLRAFELPGVVREEFATPQFGDLRDLDGVRVRAYGDRYDAMGVHGRPRYADQEPTMGRQGIVTGVTASVVPVTGLRAGGNYLRIDPQLPLLDPTQDPHPEGGGAFVECDWDRWLGQAGLPWLGLATYAEYDQVGRLGLPPSLGSPNAPRNEGYGLYLSQSAIVHDMGPGLQWGTSWEYKDYQNLALGVNEPPPVIREHAFALLNRVTHVVELQQEEGWLVESRLAYRDGAELVVSVSRAENGGSERYREVYAELNGTARGTTAVLFAAQQQDESVSVDDRDTIGLAALVTLPAGHAMNVDLELQTQSRSALGLQADNEDRYAALGWSWAGRVAVAAVRQTTDDPAETASGRRAYDSLTATIPIGSHHEASIFWGRQRSGLACTSGTCYKVRAFEGVSARLASRF